jgi:hypothetical protein
MQLIKIVCSECGLVEKATVDLIKVPSGLSESDMMDETISELINIPHCVFWSLVEGIFKLLWTKEPWSS